MNYTFSLDSVTFGTMFHNDLFNKNGADNYFFNSLCWLSIMTWTAGILFLVRSCFDRWTGKRRNNAIVWGTSSQHRSKLPSLIKGMWVMCICWVTCLCWDAICIHHVCVSCHVWCREPGFQALFKNYFCITLSTFTGESVAVHGV